MPKIDKITGCSVMTESEFWQKEADVEGHGRSAGDLRDEFFDEMEKDRIKEEKRLRDPKVALDYFKNARYFDEADLENSDPEIEEILKVHEGHYSFNFKESKISISAALLLKDKKVVNATYHCWYTSGSMIDPPDGEEFIEWGKSELDHHESP